ncbi:MAG: GAF domain-containing protein [Nitrospinae bacterium]|nr:GAF domain-containing protein [Nitrospinota bacterium]
MTEELEKPIPAVRDKRLEQLLEIMQSEIKNYALQTSAEINRLSEIGIALSSEHDLDKLLEMIVDEARRFSNADAGTLYLLDGDKLHFKILQNDTFKVRMGGTSGNEIKLPPVPMAKTNVSAFCALTGETVNIPDVYHAEGFDFTGPRKYDEATGYRSKSMLVVPMTNQDKEIIGVLQLLNAKDIKVGEVIAFGDEFVALTKSLASQAAVAVTNARLLRDMENLFDSFVTVMATAIDERSPYTSGHIKKVAELGIMMCETLNEINEGKHPDLKLTNPDKFKGVSYSKDQLKEMKIAGWMHDIGKITTPVHVVDKATKLETITDRIALVTQRFHTIMEMHRAEWQARKVAILEQGESREGLATEEAAFNEQIAKLKDDLAFITSTNKGGEFMDDGKVARIKEIASRKFVRDGLEQNYLTEDEALNLCIRKGTLLDSERKIMQDHIVVTIKMLEKIPFTKKLANVTKFAGSHHECLDGTGYPKNLKGDEIPLEGRLLSLVDFYEALTASDRPYKKPMPIKKAFEILQMEAEHNKLDKDLLELFVKAGIHEKFIKKYPPTVHPENPAPPPAQAPAPAGKPELAAKS